MNQKDVDIKKQKRSFLLKDLGRAISAYALFLAVSSIANVSFAIGSSTIIQSLNLPLHVAYIISSLLLPLTYYSCARLFELHDKESQMAYPFVDGASYRFGEGIKTLFVTPTLRRKFIIQAAVSSLLAIILPYEMGYKFVIGSFFPAFDMDFYLTKLICAAVVVPALIIITLLSKMSAHKWWVVAREPIRKEILNSVHPYLKILWGAIKIFIVYSVSYIVITTAFLMITTVAVVVGLFTLWFWAGGVIICILIIAIKIGIAMKRRRRFVRRLKKILPASGYKLSHVKRPLLSVLLPRAGADFTIEKDGIRRDCKIVGTTRRRGPMYISPDGFVTEKRTIGFWWIKICHIMTDTAYAFEGENKIVIISPMQHKIYFNFGRKDVVPDDGDGGGLPTHYAIRRGMGGLYVNEGKTRSVHGPGYKSDLDLGIIKTFETGDRVGEYKFYSPSGFISAAENNCLDR